MPAAEPAVAARPAVLDDRAERQPVTPELDAASLESDKMELRLEEVDLGALATELCRTMQPAADQRQIRMQLTLPEHPLRATCDAARIRGATWSPDGSMIAFMSNRDTGHWQIWVVNSDGSGLQNVSDGPYSDMYPVWVKNR